MEERRRLPLRAHMIMSLAALRETPTPAPGYALEPLDVCRMDALAAVQFASFQDTLDASLFPDQLASVAACRKDLGVMLQRNTLLAPTLSPMLVRGSDPVGFALLRKVSADGVTVDTLAVHPDHRHGNGRALLLHALWCARNAGITCASLDVTFADSPALRLYRSVGFLVMACLPCRRSRT